jgi:hypothetical protein
MSTNIMGYNDAGESMMREVGGCNSCANQAGGKRKLTPYTRFVKKTFPDLKKKHPDMKAPQIMKMIASMWKQTSAASKSKKPTSAKPKSKKPKSSKK